MLGKNLRNRGFSLVEAIIGITLIVIILVVSMVALNSFSKGSASLQLRDYANQALDSVLEQVRNEAAFSFDSMDETPNKERSGPHYPIIRVFGTVAPIDIATRSRDVTLIAQWTEGGQLRTKTIHQTIVFTRKKVKGATLIVKVVNILDNAQGLTGALVTVKGLDQSEYTFATTSGVVTIQGVLPDSGGVVVKVDGSAAYVPNTWSGFHFRETDVNPYGGDAAYGNTGASSTGTFISPPTQAGKILDLTSQPIQMHPPARLIIHVTDANTGNPVTGATSAPWAYVQPLQSSLIMNKTMSSAESSVVLDANGKAVYNSLIPGTYTPFFMGSSEYCMLAAPSDIMENTSGGFARDYVALNSGEEKTIELKSLKGGSLTGSVKGIHYNDSSSTWEVGTTPLSNPLKLAFHRLNSQVNINTSGNGQANLGETQIDLTQTVAWSKYGPYDNGENTATAAATTGNFSIYNFAPAILDAQKQWAADPNPNPYIPAPLYYDFTNQYGAQYAKVQMRPYDPSSIPAPLSPVIVLDPLGAIGGPGFIIVEQGHGILRTPNYIAPTMEDVGVFAGALSPNSANLYLLERNQFVNMKGNILDGGTTYYGETFRPIAPVNSATVSVPWWTQYGYGGLLIDGSNNARIDANYSLPAPVPGGPRTDPVTSYSYDMSPNGFNALPPNWGGAVTKIHYEAVTDPLTTTKDYIGQVKIHTNVCTPNTGTSCDVDNPGTVTNVEETNFSGTTMDLVATTWWGSLWNASLVGITGNSSPGTMTLNGSNAKPSKHRFVYYGNSGGLSLSPNLFSTPYSTVGTPNIDDIYVGPGYDCPAPTFIQVLENQYYYPTYGYYQFDDYGGKYRGTIDLCRKGRTGKIFGKVTGADGLPLTNVTVKLWYTNNPYWWWPTNYISQQTPTNAATDACVANLGSPCDATGDVYQFAWDNLDFIMFNGQNNIWLSVQGLESSGYYSSSNSIYPWYWPASDGAFAYNGMNWRHNFNPNKIPASGPGTGGTF